MKLLTSISLSVLFMFQAIMPNLDMGCEFQKISTMYAHYQEHRDFDGDSFLDFVLEDYINNDGSADSHHEDSNHHEAPIHNSHQCSHNSFFFNQQSQFTIETFNYNENLKFDSYKVLFSSIYLDTLFQPPQV